MRVDALVLRILADRNDPRGVIGDPHARYFGSELSAGPQLPGEAVKTAAMSFEDWLKESMISKREEYLASGPAPRVCARGRT